MVNEQTIMMGGKEHKEETVDELLEKLAKKGKKVKVYDENGEAAPDEADN